MKEKEEKEKICKRVEIGMHQAGQNSSKKQQGVGDNQVGRGDPWGEDGANQEMQVFCAHENKGFFSCIVCTGKK